MAKKKSSFQGKKIVYLGSNPSLGTSKINVREWDEEKEFNPVRLES